MAERLITVCDRCGEELGEHDVREGRVVKLTINKRSFDLCALHYCEFANWINRKVELVNV